MNSICVSRGDNFLCSRKLAIGITLGIMTIAKAGRSTRIVEELDTSSSRVDHLSNIKVLVLLYYIDESNI